MSFLLCAQALLPLTGNHAHAAGVPAALEELLPAPMANQATVRADRYERKHSEPSDSVPAQPSHESESELEEKSEKELEDDNEELDNVLEALRVVRVKYGHTTVAFQASAIRDVPTPPPNR